MYTYYTASLRVLAPIKNRWGGRLFLDETSHKIEVETYEQVLVYYRMSRAPTPEHGKITRIIITTFSKKPTHAGAGLRYEEITIRVIKKKTLG